MRIEIRGLLLALAAAATVLGATFGVSALVHGTQSEQTPQRASGAATQTAPGGKTSATQSAQGGQYYTQSCASCHGADAQGGFGPGLHNEDMSDAQITNVIKNGKGRMPAFKKYGDAQTQALVAYIHTLK